MSEPITVSMAEYQVQIPQDRYYSDMHLWFLPTEDGSFRVGLTEPQSKFLRGVCSIEYCVGAGDTVHRGDKLVVIESFKAAFEMECPIEARVVDTNSELLRKTRFTELDPYGKGWMLLIQPQKPEDKPAALMTAQEYLQLVESLVQEWKGNQGESSTAGTTDQPGRSARGCAV